MGGGWGLFKGWENGGDHLRWEDVTKASLNTEMTAGAKAKIFLCEDRFSFSLKPVFVLLSVSVKKNLSLSFLLFYFNRLLYVFYFIHIGFLSFFTSFFRWPDS